MDGFEHRRSGADIRRTRQTHRAGDLCSDVGENIAVPVRHHDGVECLGSVGQLRGSDIYDPMLLLDSRIFGADFVEDPMEEAVAELHDVVFREAGDLFAIIGNGVLEGVAYDFLGAGAGDDFEALDHLVGLLMLDAGVEVFFVFAYDNDIHARMLRLDVRMIGDAGADVGIESERLASGDVEALETAALRGGDGGLQEDTGTAEGVPGSGLNSRADAAQIHLF